MWLLFKKNYEYLIPCDGGILSGNGPVVVVTPDIDRIEQELWKNKSLSNVAAFQDEL